MAASPFIRPLRTFLVLLLIVPLQAAAEEYVFRGYLMQSIGRWLRARLGLYRKHWISASSTRS